MVIWEQVHHSSEGKASGGDSHSHTTIYMILNYLLYDKLMMIFDFVKEKTKMVQNKLVNFKFIYNDNKSVIYIMSFSEDIFTFI